MIILQGRFFVESPFRSESELEQVVVDHAEHLFGPASIYLPRRLISTRDGLGTIPDGFVVDLAQRQWFVVEAELSTHKTWSHIAPQVAKQLIAVSTAASKQLLANLVCEKAREHEQVMEKFVEQNIDEIDIRRVLAEIFAQPPIVVMPIDAVSNDLREWAATLRARVNLWIIRRYEEFGNARNVAYEIPEQYEILREVPAADCGEAVSEARPEITVADLLGMNLLRVGDVLTMSYKPRHGAKRDYTGQVREDGSIEILGQTFQSPMHAALHIMKTAGATRSSVNGWLAFKTSQGQTLAELREQFWLKITELRESAP